MIGDQACLFARLKNNSHVIHIKSFFLFNIGLSQPFNFIQTFLQSGIVNPIAYLVQTGIETECKHGGLYKSAKYAEGSSTMLALHS